MNSSNDFTETHIVDRNLVERDGCEEHCMYRECDVTGRHWNELLTTHTKIGQS